MLAPPPPVQSVRRAVHVLMEDPDPVHRCQAHTTLAHKALDNDDLDTAEVHLREATDLDPTDEVPRQLLGHLNRRQGKKAWFAFWK